jgi:hypothetical protein
MENRPIKLLFSWLCMIVSLTALKEAVNFFREREVFVNPWARIGRNEQEKQSFHH